MDEEPCARLKINYVLDPWDNQLELVEYDRQKFEDEAAVEIYRPKI